VLALADAFLQEDILQILREIKGCVEGRRLRRGSD